MKESKSLWVVSVVCIGFILSITPIKQLFAKEPALPNTQLSNTGSPSVPPSIVLAEAVEMTAANIDASGCGGMIPAPFNAQFEQQVVEVINTQRAAQGLPPFKLVAELSNAARYQAMDMGQEDYLLNDTYDLISGDLVLVCSFGQRIQSYYPNFAGVAENIDQAPASPQAFISHMLNFTAQRNNIFGSNREIGVGYHPGSVTYPHTWVTDFATSYDSYPLIINLEAAQTLTPTVSLYVYGTWQEIRLRNDNDAWSAWQPFNNSLSWTLSATGGLRTVSAEVRSSTGASKIVSDTIEFLATLPTATPTNTPLPTHTPTPTPVGQVQTSPGQLLYLSASTGGSIAGITYESKDILAYDTTKNSWSMVYDGSTAGLPASTTIDVNAFEADGDQSLLLSFNVSVTIPGIGVVSPSDIVRFIPTVLGNTTAGTYVMVLDGSDVGLDNAFNENIDAIGRTPDGKLVISTIGSFAVPGLAGNDEDLIVFNATSLGDNTAGTWQMYFDGSDVGLGDFNEDVQGLWIDPSTGYLHLTMQNGFATTSGLTGDANDVLICAPLTLGDSTSCSYALEWQGEAAGFGGSKIIDGLEEASNPIPIPTSTPTIAPTATSTPTPSPTPVGGIAFYVSAALNGTVSGISYADEDILSFNPGNKTWSMFFDGSDVGVSLANNLDAMEVESDGSILMSFAVSTTLPYLGAVSYADIVRFTPLTLGAVTSGTFSMVLDGSDVGLDSSSENIDAIGRAPNGNLVVSTAGNFQVGTVIGGREDLFSLTATQLGDTTAGSWKLYFDGSDVGLTLSTEDIEGVWIDPGANNLFLSASGSFTTSSGLGGDGNDIYICAPNTLGDTTSCTFYPYWNGGADGLGTMALDGIEIGPAVLPIQQTSASGVEEVQFDLPLASPQTGEQEEASQDADQQSLTQQQSALDQYEDALYDDVPDANDLAVNTVFLNKVMLPLVQR